MFSRTRAGTALSALFVLLALGACGGTSSSLNDPFGAAGDRNEIRVIVMNSNFYDARVYILVDGVRRQLGTVGGKKDGVFTMPWTFSRVTSLEINMQAGETCRTEALPVDPGDTLQLQIMPAASGADLCR